MIIITVFGFYFGNVMSLGRQVDNYARVGFDKVKQIIFDEFSSIRNQKINHLQSFAII